MFMKKELNHRGDTLVEVLIATVIIGFVLIGGYVAVNHNETVELQSQERSVALQLNQTQVERLRALVSNGTFSLTSTPTTTQLCVNENGNVIEEADKCYFDSKGNWSSEPITSGISYQITLSAVNGTWNQVKVNNNWLETGSSGGQSTAILAYHFYPTPQAVSAPTGPTDPNGGVCGAYYTHLQPQFSDEFFTDTKLDASKWTSWNPIVPYDGVEGYYGTGSFSATDGLDLTATYNNGQFSGEAIRSNALFGGGCVEVEAYIPPNDGSQDSCWPGLEIYPIGSTQTGMNDPTDDCSYPEGTNNAPYSGWNTYAIVLTPFECTSFYVDDVLQSGFPDCFSDSSGSGGFAWYIGLENPTMADGFSCGPLTNFCTSDDYFHSIKVWE